MACQYWFNGLSRFSLPKGKFWHQFREHERSFILHAIVNQVVLFPSQAIEGTREPNYRVAWSIELI